MPRRTEHQREADLELINAWYLQGHSQRWIAAELEKVRGYSVSQETISNDLSELRKRWEEKSTSLRNAHVAQELARIDLLEQEYWSQYEASKGDVTVTTERKKGASSDKVIDVSGLTSKEKPKDTPKPADTDSKETGRSRGKAISRGEQSEVVTRTEYHTGNPAYMAGIERCIKLRMDLLGLEAPKILTHAGGVALTWGDIIKSAQDYDEQRSDGAPRPKSDWSDTE